MAISDADLQKSARALPPSKEGDDPTLRALQEVDVLRLDQILQSLGSSLPQLVRSTVAGIANETTEELPHTAEGYIILNLDQLDSIVTRAALGAGIAVAATIGDNLASAQALEAALLGT